jgi:hypothetical protein
MVATKVRFSVATAIASHIGVDQAEMEENYRYQPTRTPCRVYNDRDGTYYLTATTAGRRPKATDDYHLGTWTWREVSTSGYVKAMGWRVWRAVQDDEPALPDDVALNPDEAKPRSSNQRR